MLITQHMEANLNKISFPISINQNLILRQLLKSDAETFLDAVNEDREYLAKKVPWVHYRTTKAEVIEYFEKLDQRYSSNIGFCIGIFHNNKFAGEMKVHTVDWQHRKAEVGYWLRKSYIQDGQVKDSIMYALTNDDWKNLKNK